MTDSPTRRAARRADAPSPFMPIHPAGLISALVGIAVVVIWGLAVLSVNATGIDIWLNDRHTPLFDGTAILIATLFSPMFAVVVGVVFAAVVAGCTRSVAYGLGAGVTVGVAWMSSYAVKVLVHRSRPDFALIAHHIVRAETDPSFPSGHTTFVTCLAVVTVLLVWRTRWRPTAVTVGAIVVVIVAVSRMYTGVHDINDVGASVLYGACSSLLLFALVGWVIQRWRLQQRIDAPLARALAPAGATR